MKGLQGRDRDQTLLMLLGAVVLVLIGLMGVLAPATATNNPRPGVDNAGPRGAKAIFLTLERLGRPAARWDQPISDLGQVDAARTTLVLLAPQYTALDHDRLAAGVKAFLQRGGRVLTTGGEGALLLPGGSTKSGRRFGTLCTTAPEGPGPLAAMGPVEMEDVERWGDPTPAGQGLGFAEQRCGLDAVVERLPVGRGEAVWWSSPAPLTNAGLSRKGDLRLTLASLGEGRTVLFDESLGGTVPSKWSAAAGLPLPWMLGQAALVFGLLVFSFSRRRGPVRLPVHVPRSSPVEFAVNMGDLYEKAGATGAATEAARRRLERVLVREARLPERTVNAGPEAVSAALRERFGGDWDGLGEHLREAAHVGETKLKAGSALRLVRALGEDGRRVQRAAGPKAEPAIPEPAR